tara:strand:+ start:377 stop:562 length:186 start_codon:yes stop_codon:yes gene_type:complete
MIMRSMNVDKTSQKAQELHVGAQHSAWMLAQCARLHNESSSRASSSLLAAIVASLVMFGLQ